MKKEEHKIKIFAAADFQGNELISKELAKKAEKEQADVVVIAGDILDFGEYAKNMIKPFVEKGKKVIFVPGNHDTEEATKEFEKNYSAKNLHGTYAVLGDVGFFGCGGSTLPFFNYAMDEEEIYETLKKAYEKIKYKPRKVMITHMHPAGGVVEKFTFPGSLGIRKAIEKFKPDVHICGHIHEMEGTEDNIGKTRSIVVGSRGVVIEI